MVNYKKKIIAQVKHTLNPYKTKINFGDDYEISVNVQHLSHWIERLSNDLKSFKNDYKQLSNKEIILDSLKHVDNLSSEIKRLLNKPNVD